jgi:hypothetical protein
VATLAILGFVSLGVATLAGTSSHKADSVELYPSKQGPFPPFFSNNSEIVMARKMV